ncbi:MAG: PEP-CTERM sorting domain-containing protein [Phycisphaerae bacterium]|nr:PEP-CTERM sorting domain-containing protein [Phycisphaerae bacterium]
MKKLLILALVLGVASSVLASNDWLTSAASSDWFDAANWDDGVVPSLTDTTNTRTFQTHMNTNYMPIINSGDAEVGQLEIGGDSQALIPGNFATVTLNGGTLTTVDYFRHGASSSSTRWGKFIMTGGTCNVGGYMATGYGNSGAETKGWTIVSGGTINVAGDWRFANGSTASGYAYISGGTVTVAGILNMRPSGGTGDTLLDITGSGKVVLAGDQIEQVLAYRDNGWIQSDGEEFLDEWITFDGTNTVLAIPEPATLCILAVGAFGLIRRK